MFISFLFSVDVFASTVQLYNISFDYPSISSHDFNGSFSGNISGSGSFTYNENGSINISGTYLETLSTAGWIPVFNCVGTRFAYVDTSSAPGSSSYVYHIISSLDGFLLNDNNLVSYTFSKISFSQISSTHSEYSYTTTVPSGNFSTFSICDIVDFYRPDSGTFASSSGSIVSNGDGTFSINLSLSGSFTSSSNISDRLFFSTCSIPVSYSKSISYIVRINLSVPSIVMSPGTSIPLDVRSSLGIISNNNSIIYNGTISLSFEFYSNVDSNSFGLSFISYIPEHMSFKIPASPSGNVSFISVSETFPSKQISLLDSILSSLTSSSGSSSSTDSAIGELDSTFSQFQTASDTSKYYGNIDDSFFTFNTDAFSQVASTITLFSSLTSSIVTSLGDFSTPLFLSLTIVVMSSIIGLARYASTSGSGMNGRRPKNNNRSKSSSKGSGKGGT